MKTEYSPIRPTPSAPHSHVRAEFWELKISDFMIFGTRGFRVCLRWAGRYRK